MLSLSIGLVKLTVCAPNKVTLDSAMLAVRSILALDFPPVCQFVAFITVSSELPLTNYGKSFC